MIEENTRHKNKKKKRNRRLILLAIGIFLLAYGGIWKVYHDVNNTGDSIFNHVDTNNKRDGQLASINASEPISFALLGVDNGVIDREDEPGRTDAIIIGTVNPKTKQTTLLSIPRDSYALMEGYETGWGDPYYDKLTHAYAFGEAEMTIDSIQELLNIPIDYYVEVNMQGLMDVVDAIGGIQITSPLTFDYQGNYFVEGKKQKLDGKEALAFSRMRKTDPEGDFGRQKRQKLVVEAIIDKLLSFSTLTRYQSVLKTMQDNVKTNIPFRDMGNIIAGYRNALGNIKQDSLYGEELWLDEVYYLYIDPLDRLEVSNDLRKELELDPVELADLNLSDTDYYYLDEPYYYMDDSYNENYDESFYEESNYEESNYEESYQETPYVEEEPSVYLEESDY